MRKYDARLIRTAIAAIRLCFLDKCFNNNFKHFRNSLFITVAQSSYISTFKFYLCSNFIISCNWKPTSIYLIFLSTSNRTYGCYKSYRCNISWYFLNSPVYLCFPDLQIFSSSFNSFLQNRRTFHLPLVGVDSLYSTSSTKK